MTIPARNVSITGVFAENATTTIPEYPSPGVSYRDSKTTAAQMNAGFAFKTIVDSSKFNQALYEYSAITQMQEKYGFIPWSNLTDYVKGSVCIGTDGVVYQAKKATGPSSTAFNPVEDNSHTYWDILYTKDVVTINGKQTILGDKAFAGGLTVQRSLAPQVIVKNTSYTKGALPTSNIKDPFVELHDSANNPLSSLYTRINTAGDVYTAIAAYLNTADVNENAQIGVTYKKDGTVTTSCPASDKRYSIVTTTGISKDERGYVQLGNGIIIQWGSEDVPSGDGNMTITFPTPFSSNESYSITKNYGSYSSGTTLNDNEGSFFYLTATTATTSNNRIDTARIQWMAIGY